MSEAKTITFSHITALAPRTVVQEVICSATREHAPRCLSSQLSTTSRQRKPRLPSTCITLSDKQIASPAMTSAPTRSVLRDQINIPNHAGVMHLAVTPALADFPAADPAAEYQRRTSQSNSAFDIDQPARISRRTAARSGQGIREAVKSHRPFEFRNKMPNNWSRREFTFCGIWEGPYPSSGAVGPPSLGNSGPPSALNRISNY